MTSQLPAIAQLEGRTRATERQRLKEHISERMREINRERGWKTKPGVMQRGGQEAGDRWESASVVMKMLGTDVEKGEDLDGCVSRWNCNLLSGEIKHYCLIIYLSQWLHGLSGSPCTIHFRFVLFWHKALMSSLQFTTPTAFTHQMFGTWTIAKCSGANVWIKTLWAGCNKNVWQK